MLLTVIGLAGLFKPPLPHKCFAPFLVVIHFALLITWATVATMNLGIIKFTEKGSIELRSFRKRNSIIVEVKDTGKGIPVEKKKSIFEPFMQVNNETMEEL